MISVAESSPKALNPSSIIAPFTSPDRSLPPTPNAWEIPSPDSARRQITCCRPLPDAETNPTRPLGTALAKPRGTPFMIAVPQSGPIINRPRLIACCFRSTSSSSVTLSLKSNTLSPRSRAFLASRAACSPGTEIIARLAWGNVCNAPSMERGR